MVEDEESIENEQMVANDDRYFLGLLFYVKSLLAHFYSMKQFVSSTFSHQSFREPISCLHFQEFSIYFIYNLIRYIINYKV